MSDINIKMNFFSLNIILISLFSIIYGQGPDTIWTKTYGGINHDEGKRVKQTLDGGYIIGAETQSYGAGLWDIWLIKTDSFGETVWTRTYGGDDNEACRAVLQTPDRGYFIGGWTESFGLTTLPDIYLLKTDSLGDTLWTRRYGSWNPDLCYSAALTSDGGYIVAGSTWSYGPGGQSGYVLKLNSNGDTLWTKTYGGIDEDLLYSVQQTPDHGYIICGSTASFGAGDYDAWLIKTDSLGDTIWTRTWGGSSWDYADDLDQTNDGGYIIVGWTNSFGANGSDVWLIKVDANGDTQWQKVYGDLSWDEGRVVHQLSNGGYIVGGFQEYPPGSNYSDGYIIRTDINGDSLWTKHCGYDNFDELILSLQPTLDGGYIAVGTTQAYGAGLTDVWLLKLDADTFDIGEETKKSKPSYNMIISPNPFWSKTIISTPSDVQIDINTPIVLRIYDINGRLVKDYELSNNGTTINQIPWDGSDNKGISMPSGVYFIQIIYNKQTTINKVVKLK